MQRMLAESRAIFHQFKTTSTTGLFLNPIVAITRFSAFEPDVFSHDSVPFVQKS